MTPPASRFTLRHASLRRSEMTEVNNPGTSVSAADRAAIDGFLERIWSEQGLADNTLASYRRDLEGLARWLAKHGSGLDRCSRESLYRYLAERSARGGRRGTGYTARSNA